MTLAYATCCGRRTGEPTQVKAHVTYLSSDPLSHVLCPHILCSLYFSILCPLSCQLFVYFFLSLSLSPLFSLFYFALYAASAYVQNICWPRFIILPRVVASCNSSRCRCPRSTNTLANLLIWVIAWARSGNYRSARVARHEIGKCCQVFGLLTKNFSQLTWMRSRRQPGLHVLTDFFILLSIDESSV